MRCRKQFVVEKKFKPCFGRLSRTGNDPGGLAGIRTERGSLEAAHYLQRKWGKKASDIGGGKKRGQLTTLRVSMM